jgi:hypothetical protein
MLCDKVACPILNEDVLPPEAWACDIEPELAGLADVVSASCYPCPSPPKSRSIRLAASLLSSSAIPWESRRMRVSAWPMTDMATASATPADSSKRSGAASEPVESHSLEGICVDGTDAGIL